MGKGNLFWSGQRVMERWSIYSTELAAHIYNGLPAFRMENGEFLQVSPEEVNYFDANHMTDFVFNPDDVIGFEKEHGITPIPDPELENAKLAAEDARELGFLRKEKAKWDISIEAAVQVAIFCSTLGRPVLKKEVTDEIWKINSTIPDTTIDKIWQALPQKYKKGPGRPRKEPVLSNNL
ncbi:MAG: hypothetical protein DRG82_16685 [Deltaproteobacteria bacterium]|nr:MAG: hypothetical protein DRG82_16685 [Deltaproteobacteria bacterium]